MSDQSKPGPTIPLNPPFAQGEQGGWARRRAPREDRPRRPRLRRQLLLRELPARHVRRPGAARAGPRNRARADVPPAAARARGHRRRRPALLRRGERLAAGARPALPPHAALGRRPPRRPAAAAPRRGAGRLDARARPRPDDPLDARAGRRATRPRSWSGSRRGWPRRCARTWCTSPTRCCSASPAACASAPARPWSAPCRTRRRGSTRWRRRGPGGSGGRSRSAPAEVDAFIAVSRHYAGVMELRAGIAADRVRVVPIGVDVASYPAASPDPAAPVIGYLARMSEACGLGELVDGLPAPARAAPEAAPAR